MNTSSLDNEKELEMFICEGYIHLLKTSTQKHATIELVNLVNKGKEELALLNQIPSLKD